MDDRVFAGKYRAVRELSSDVAGRTWLANAADDTPVVVKVVHPPDAATAEAIEHDVELASGIHHPALPAILEWGHEDGGFFIVREYIAGTDLKTELALQDRFAPFTVARYGSEAANALSLIHGRGLVHGNVRTANLVRLPSDEIRLVGTGLGIRDAAIVRRIGTAASAAWYMAPEVVEGAPSSPSSDVYALGAVLYELVTGRPVFDGKNAAEVSAHQLHTAPVPLRDLVPDTPVALEAVIMRALEKAPMARWPSAGAMGAALDRVELDESPVPGIDEPPARKSRAGLWAALAVVVVLVAVGAAWALGLFGGGGIAVPDVAGKSLPQARAAVIAAGLNVGAVTYAGVPVAAVADGLVSEQSPVAGAKAPKGSKVDLVLAGREMLSVPDAAGRLLADAESLIEGAGLTVGTITNVTTTAVTAGMVTAQTPEQGAQAAKGSPIDLWVSQAPATAPVPSVVGLTQVAADAALVNAGLVVVVAKQASGTVANGLVIDQTPAAGVIAQVGSTVTIRVSTGPAQVTVPNVIGKTQAAAVNTLSAVGFLSQVTLQTGGGTVGTVVDQSPNGATKAASGSTVVITVVQ